MDATLHPFRRFSLFTVALILSGCQTTKPTPVKTPQPGLAVFNSVLVETPEPNSIIRERDRITYVVVSSLGPEDRYLARFDADCKQPDAQMAYRSKGGMSRFAIDPRGRTEESWQLPAEQKSQYLQSAQFKQVCAQTASPEWRVFSAPEHQDWQMIDRASLKVKGDEVTFWTARVQPAELLLPDQTSLYGQVRQRWTANCSRQELTALSSFYLDKRSRVIAGEMKTNPEAIRSQSLSADERRLLELGCGTPQSLDQYAHFDGREQSSFELPVPVVTAPVLKAIAALKMPKPEKSIQHLRLVFKDMSEPKQFSEVGVRYKGRDARYQPEASVNQLLERFKSAREQRANVSFRGLIKLADSKFTTVADLIEIEDSALSDLRFEGDWANMPVGALLSYTVQRPTEHYGKGLVPVDDRFTCDVESQKPASAYYPSLTGTAKVFSCTGDDYHLGQGTAFYAYLEAYGMFVPVRYVAKDWQGEWSIEALE